MSKKSIINPKFGVPDSSIRSQIRSALRKVWRNSSRRVFLENIRFPYKGKKGRWKYAVKCVHCDKEMGFSEKDYRIKKDGIRTKKKKLIYEVNHIGTGNHSFTDIKRDLGEFAHDLLNNDLEVLCRQCHQIVTNEQKEFKKLKKVKKLNKENKIDMFAI